VMVTLNCTFERGALSPFQHIASLSAESRTVVENALISHGARLIPGLAITTRGTQLNAQQFPELSNPILEMETSGILEAAKESGVPLIVLRSVSDGPKARVPFDLEKVMDDNYIFRPSKLLLDVLLHPRILFLSVRMIRNSRIAADQAAIAVMTVLDQPGSFLS
jgi:nucleoside phosphorylase